ncbi:YiiX/YebB-like N1pC/P60 family cysteine hydrolase, partial [Rhizobium rhizosphaerae]|uniref:YiiX/YebB-like N1pC/P60 family cysteine hydrolase n=1 Tax=Xaviernesmea rhizosphaerae TaxID=1672749 RepID=UPI0018E99BEF
MVQARAPREAWQNVPRGEGAIKPRATASPSFAALSSSGPPDLQWQIWCNLLCRVAVMGTAVLAPRSLQEQQKRSMRLLKKLLVVCGLLLVLGLGAAWAMSRSLPDLPPLKDGDLIFQTSTSNQSLAILAATASAYSHMGIVRLTESGPVVIEAAGRVRETPLAAWIARGVLRRVAVYRDPALTPEDAERVLARARTLYGRPYDIFFSFDNDAIYCSELPYLAFQAVGLSLGSGLINHNQKITVAAMHMLEKKVC